MVSSLGTGPRLGSVTSKRYCMKRSAPESAGFMPCRYQGTISRSRHLLLLCLNYSRNSLLPYTQGVTAKPRPVSQLPGQERRDSRSRFGNQSLPKPPGKLAGEAALLTPDNQTWSPRSPRVTTTRSQASETWAQRDDVHGALAPPLPFHRAPVLSVLSPG